MYGVAKQPRINPGTILNNPVLRPLLSKSRIEELEKMSKTSLWQLEEKYDAVIGEIYGKNRFQLNANIHAHVVLNWKHDSENSTEINRVDMSQRQDLLEAIMKSPGPFYMDQNGQGWENGGITNRQTYIDILSTIEVYEISGKVDFEAMVQPLIKLIKR
jgi:HprK-related kinase B